MHYTLPRIRTNNRPPTKKGIGAVARQAQESHPRPGPSRRSRDGDLGGSAGDEGEPDRRDGEGHQPVGEGVAPAAAADAAAERPLGALNRTIQSDHSRPTEDGHSVSTGGGGSGGGGRPALPSQSRQQRSNSSAQRRGKLLACV